MSQLPHQVSNSPVVVPHTVEQFESGSDDQSSVLQLDDNHGAVDISTPARDGGADEAVQVEDSFESLDPCLNDLSSVERNSHISDENRQQYRLSAPCVRTASTQVFSTFPSALPSTIAILQLQLPNIEQIRNLVDYHERYLLWYHGCYHGPTLRRELEDALLECEDVLQIDGLNLQWIALLFSIMAGSLACATDHLISEWGFWKGETSKLSKQWYKAAVTCLNQSEYTTNHQIFAVHAITTLSMSAHTLGLSEDLSVLLGAALKIARSLGLDRLKYNPALDSIQEVSTIQQRHRVLRREIGRRLWSQLCVQDWFALPFTGSQCISLTDFTSTKPLNRDHVTMASLPESFPTYISYGNYVYNVAKLIAEHHIATVRSSTPFTKYEQVMEFDARMRNLARKEMPKYFHVTAPIDPSWPEFIPWARRSLTISFAHKIIMIHRAFIRQSFANPAFQKTRVTCIAAAKTILKEAKQEQEEDGPIIWIDQVSNLESSRHPTNKIRLSASLLESSFAWTLYTEKTTIRCLSFMLS